MERPFILVDFRLTHRDEFDVKSGHHHVNAMFIVTKGSYRITMANKEEVMKKGDVMIFSGYEMFDRSVIEPLEFVYIKFKINPKCPFSIPIPYGKVAFKDKARIESDIQKYLELERTTDHKLMFYKEHILNDILYQAYLDNFVHPVENVNRIEDQTVKSAIDYINNNMKEHISIPDICKAASTNPSTLNFKFKKEMDMSPMQYITHKKIELAKWLLSNSTYSITEISRRCGFLDVYYFSNFFKKNVKMTPSDYRRQYL